MSASSCGPWAPSGACRQTLRRSRAPALALGGDRLQCIGAEAARERLAQQRVLGRLQLGIARDDRLRPRAGTLLQFGVVGQTGHAELPKPGLARAHQLALLAQREVDLGQSKAVAVS